MKELLGVGSAVPNEQWTSIVTEVDANGDGEISLEEFIAMMTQLLGS